MQSGWLRHRITIQSKSVSQDSYGEPDETWSTYVNAWASVEPLRGREFMDGMAQGQEVTHRIRMRQRDGVTPEMRVSFDSRVFQIESVINVLEKDREMILMCQELV